MLRRFRVISLTSSVAAFAAWPAAAQAPSAGRSSSRPDSVLVALERRGWEGATRKDATPLFDVMGPDGFLFIAPWGTHRVSRDLVATEIRDCQTVSYAMDSVAVMAAGENVAVLTYRLTLDQTCGGERLPSPLYVMQVWVRHNDKWTVVTRSVTVAGPAPAQQAHSRFIPQTNSSVIDSNGTAHVTRVISVPTTVSPEAQKWLARQVPDTEVHMTPAEVRAGADALTNQFIVDAQPLYPTKLSIDTIAGVPVRIVTPPAIPAERRNRVLIDVHGGGWISDQGSAAETIPIASLTRTKVVAVLYRLMPEHPFPAAVDDVVAVYRKLLETYRPEDIAIYGTSSGAIITAEAAVKLRQSGLPLPAALGIFSGAGDATHAGVGDSFATYGTFGFSGPLISDCPSCTDVAGYIGRTDPRDPVLSPVFADLTGFPPTLFLTSTRDLALSGTTILHRAFLKAGVHAELVVFEALAHAFWSNSNLLTLPETVEANHMIAAFFDRQLGRSGARPTVR